MDIWMKIAITGMMFFGVTQVIINTSNEPKEIPDWFKAIILFIWGSSAIAVIFGILMVIWG